jgi:hypothetical protein
MSEYTFPFNTCEKVNKNGIAQPYSLFFNLINCIIILYFLLQTKNNYTFMLLFLILCFELFHSFSHIVHIKGSIQLNIIHLLTYLINFAFFYLFYSYTKKFPNKFFILYLIVLVCLDIYSIFNLTIIYYLSTQSIIFISLLLYYYRLLPKIIQNSIYQLILLVGFVILLVLNETYNCERMLEFYPHFPYHIFIEITGIVFFYVICSNFYKL